jgi:hypothetical protein
MSEWRIKDEDNEEDEEENVGVPSAFPSSAINFIPELVDAKNKQPQPPPLAPKIEGCLPTPGLKELLYWGTLVRFAQAVNSKRRLITNPEWAVDLVNSLNVRAGFLRAPVNGRNLLDSVPNQLENAWNRVPTGKKVRYGTRLEDLRRNADGSTNGDVARALKTIPMGREYNDMGSYLIVLFSALQAENQARGRVWDILLIGVAFLEGDNAVALTKADNLEVAIVHESSNRFTGNYQPAPLLRDPTKDYTSFPFSDVAGGKGGSSGSGGAQKL